MKRRTLLVGLLATALSLPATAQSMFRGDPAHSGVAVSDLPPVSTPASINASTSRQRISSVSVCSSTSSSPTAGTFNSDVLISAAVAVVVVPMMPPSD